jgi:ParB-like chromosome segregation protein Spo0J
MAEEDFRSLCASIAESGQREPIVLLEGQVLDGWQRYRACQTVGCEPIAEAFEGDDPVSYVRDKHTRRPLNLTQRMTAIALMHEWMPKGRPEKCAPGAHSVHATAADMAQEAGGSLRTMVQVKEAIAKGAPELVEAMKIGAVSAKRAASIAKLPPEQQPQALSAPPAPAPAPAANSAPIERVTELEEQVRQLTEQLEEARDDMASMAAVLDSGDHTAAALVEAKKFRDLARGYRARIDSMTTEIADLKRTVGSLEKRLKRATEGAAA